jgi:hypothetical protein
VTITVRNGRPSGGNEAHRAYDTVPELFHAIAADLDTPNYNQARVSYNRHFGYPRSVFLDPMANVADDELSLTITRFRILR